MKMRRSNTSEFSRTDFRAALVAGLVLIGGLSQAQAQAQAQLELFSEQDYFREIPQVFATSRMPQSPQDSSGANTLIDRSFIQASGARNLAELMVGLPGLQVGLRAGGRPVVAYHGLSGQVTQRMQVFVDGRSLYAPYMFGGVDWSTISVPLDEIDRIEVHRGSNSAAYGANAFLGVIQIYTRAAVQAAGVSAQILRGSNGIADQSVRLGQSDDHFQWRIVASQRGDEGLSKREDNFSTQGLDFRADYQKSATESLMLLAGIYRGRFGEGSPESIADPVRNQYKTSTFSHLQFKNLVDEGQEWSLSASWTQDKEHDAYPVSSYAGGVLNLNNERQANRYSLEYQHYKTLTPTLRASWGGEYRRDQVQSFELFSSEDIQKNAAWRLYYNQEWKPLDHWTVNAGGLIEKDDYSPTQLAPRLSVNWKPSPQHVFKIGYSSAFRTPSLFEQRSDWRVRDETGQTLYTRYLSRGGLVPERVKATDLVYQGQWPKLNAMLELRVFREEITRLITPEFYLLPQSNASNAVAYDLRNNAQATQQGAEYQLSWKPFDGSTLTWNEYRARTVSSKSAVQSSVPRSSSSLTWMHRFNHNLSLTGAYARTGSMTWLGEATGADAQKILALSIQKTFKLEQAHVRTSLTLRRPVGSFNEYRELQSMPQSIWLGLQIER